MVALSDFIFKGKVINVQYRNSESVPLTDPSGAPVYEEGIPVMVDGSNLPHTFVTYQIEYIYRGAPPTPTSTSVTLRFVGGVDTQNPGRILSVPVYPHMDLNDRDVLFVHRNTVKDCPLVQSEQGRFRIILPPNATTRKIYNDSGRQVLRVDNPTPDLDQAYLGPYQSLAEVTTHSFGNCSSCVLETIVEEAENEFSLPGQEGGSPEQGQPLGVQFTEAQFDSFIAYVINVVFPPPEIPILPPVTSANISQPFYAPVLAAEQPKTLPTEISEPLLRPWLDQLPQAQRNAILESERQEEELFLLTGGDPVLPSTPCEMLIFTEGAIPGDISGPGGRPDCYVNLYDLARMAQFWMVCNNPTDTLCGL